MEAIPTLADAVSSGPHKPGWRVLTHQDDRQGRPGVVTQLECRDVGPNSVEYPVGHRLAVNQVGHACSYVEDVTRPQPTRSAA